MVDLVQQYDPDAEGGKFDDLPAGKYEAQIVESRREPVSQNQDIGECLVLGWQIVGGPFEKRMIWQRLNLWFTGNNFGQVVQIANSQFADVRKAAGLTLVNDSTELHHIRCRVTWGPQKKNPQYSEVKGVSALGGAPDRQAASSPSPQQRPANTQATATTGRPWGQKKSA